MEQATNHPSILASSIAGTNESSMSSDFSSTLPSYVSSIGCENKEFCKENAIGNGVDDNAKYIINESNINTTGFEAWENPTYMLTNISNKSMATSQTETLAKYELNNDNFTNNQNYPMQNSCAKAPSECGNYPTSFHNQTVQPLLNKNSLQDLIDMLKLSNDTKATSMYLPLEPLDLNIQQSYPYDSVNNVNQASLRTDMNMQTTKGSSFSPNQVWKQNLSINSFVSSNYGTAPLQQQQAMDNQMLYNAPMRKFSDPTPMSGYGNHFNSFYSQNNYTQPILYSTDHLHSSNDPANSTNGFFHNDSSNGDFLNVVRAPLPLETINLLNNYQYTTNSFSMYNNDCNKDYNNACTNAYNNTTCNNPCDNGYNNDLMEHLNKLLYEDTSTANNDIDNTFMDNFLQNEIFKDFNFKEHSLSQNGPISEGYQAGLLLGVHVNNLGELFNYNYKREHGKSLLQFTTKFELLDYISHCTFYGNSIEAINIGKLFDLGLEQREMTEIVRKWLVQMFNNEYTLYKNNNYSTYSSQNQNVDQLKFDNSTNYKQKNKDDALNSFGRLTNFIRLYNLFVTKFDIIKSILRENSDSGVKLNVDEINHMNENNIDSTMDSNNSQQTILSPLFVQFTINSYHEYYSHKSLRSHPPINHLMSKLTIPTVVNCLMYSEKHNDIKLYMLDSENGALADLIIMNLPYLWSRDGKQFICHICENFYTRKYGLKIHLRTHNSNKPLECEVCKKAFRDPSNLVKHSKIHNKCNLSSNDSSQLTPNGSTGYSQRPSFTNYQSPIADGSNNYACHARKRTSSDIR